jgi:hypothetical protein
MQRKQGGNHKAAPGEFRCALQQQEKEDNVGRVKQYIPVVMSGRVQAEKSKVESVRQPGQGMPVRLGIGGKSPFHCGPRQARLDMGVVRDVSMIVEVDEPVVSDLVVEPKDNRGQHQAQK